MSELLFPAVVIGLCFVGYGLTILFKPRRHRPLSQTKSELRPTVKRELGMEALDMNIVDKTNNENRRLAAKTGRNWRNKPNNIMNAATPRFMKSGDKK